MNDMSQVIIPKSDQINSDDLIAGPITVTICEVRISPGSEQPVSIVLEGTDKFYRPCKSMSRVLVQAWGPDAKAYIGRSLTLYRDPTVKWAGMEIGGIRISHMSDIDGVKQMMLTATKGSRKPFKVLPLVVQAKSGATDHSATLAELKTIATPGNTDALGAKWKEIGADARKALAAELPALKAACLAPAEDVPFDAVADPPAETVDTETGEITTDAFGLEPVDEHPGKAKADALIAEIENVLLEKVLDDLMETHAETISALSDEDGVRVEVAASKRREAMQKARAKAGSKETLV